MNIKEIGSQHLSLLVNWNISLSAWNVVLHYALLVPIGLLDLCKSSLNFVVLNWVRFVFKTFALSWYDTKEDFLFFIVYNSQFLDQPSFFLPGVILASKVFDTYGNRYAGDNLRDYLNSIKGK